MPKVGTKLQGPSASGMVVVVRDGGGEIVVDDNAASTLQVGKRYGCSSCDAEVLVVKPGRSTISCHRVPMTLKQPKKTAAAD